ncbi:hypothetical protein ID875_22230 [Streptomyces globisporus]|uniref:Uncharacterized protein n=1 Tax=Streptomyces globisporus TaxID=1908 RepID=A0A927BNR8_STRGL|nr:hypothetical protein [Streptomyces globisporus]
MSWRRTRSPDESPSWPAVRAAARQDATAVETSSRPSASHHQWTAVAPESWCSSSGSPSGRSRSRATTNSLGRSPGGRPAALTAADSERCSPSMPAPRTGPPSGSAQARMPITGGGVPSSGNVSQPATSSAGADSSLAIRAARSRCGRGVPLPPDRGAGIAGAYPSPSQPRSKPSSYWSR